MHLTSKLPKIKVRLTPRLSLQTRANWASTADIYDTEQKEPVSSYRWGIWESGVQEKLWKRDSNYSQKLSWILDWLGYGIRKETLFPAFCRVVEIVLYSIKSFFQERSQSSDFFSPANYKNTTTSNSDTDITIILKGNTSGVQHANLKFYNKLELEVEPLVISFLNHENTCWLKNTFIMFSMTHAVWVLEPSK